MTTKEYNGWTNYETWIVKLWIDNEEATQQRWREEAKQAWVNAEDSLSAYARFTGKEIFSRDEKAVLDLEQTLKTGHEEALPELEGFTADLLSAAMSEVNWHEIAQHLVDSAKEALAA